MDEENLSPNQMSEGYSQEPVQGFAFGGIAIPSQQIFLRGSDKAYLAERQKELDAYEAQRLAYNDQLTKWQNEVYNPYKTQVDAYNAASQKYNTDVYNPYKTQVDAYNAEAQKYNEEVYNPYKAQFDKYKEAVDAWNAGPRDTDYAGPSEPTLARQFTLTAPTQPKAFDMVAPTTPEGFKGVAPVMPFKEEEIKAYQEAAAKRARQDAGHRAVAIDVVSDPERFNFGSMSISNRFMAKGGEVKEKSAKEMLGEMGGGREPTKDQLLKMIQEVSSNGKLSNKQILQAVERVAAAGRGGDELLAYLSPESVKLLKKMGGSGTINPATGLQEFKGGFIGKIVDMVKNVFSPKSAAPAASAASAASAPASAAAAAPAADAPAPPSAAELMKQLEASNSAREALQAKYDTDLVTFKSQAEKDREEAIKAALATDAQKRATMIARPMIGNRIPQFQDNMPVGNTAKDLLAQMPSGDPMSKNFVGPRSPEEEARFKGQATDKKGFTRDPNEIGTMALVPWYNPKTGESYVAPDGATKPPSDDWVRGEGPNGMPNLKRPPGFNEPTPIPQLTPVATPSLDFGRRLSSPGVGAEPPKSPAFGGVDQDNFFALNPKSSTGISPGTMAIGSPDMPMFGAMNTMNTLGSNKNLSPGMLGGQESLGFFSDRLGNTIYSAAQPQLYRTFAKGGMAERLAASNAYNMSDSEEQAINTDPLGSAQRMMSELMDTRADAPNEVSIKRLPKSGGASKGKSKEMAMDLGDLATIKDMQALTSAKAMVPELKGEDSARSQMEALALAYKLKAKEATNQARGLMRNTMGAPTLEKPTLTKSSLTKQRFEKGGEAKKDVAESTEEPGVFGVSDYATKASARMFPDQKGQDDQRDAVRHMLAAGIVAQKYGPGTAKFLGKAHERLSNPKSFFNMLGIGDARYDYDVDVHNNNLGVELAARAKTQAELEKMVQELAKKSVDKQTPGRPWTVSRQQLEAIDEKTKKAAAPPQYRSEGSPKEGELSQAEIDAASKPAFVTPKSGKGRKQGEISRQLNSGEAYVNMAKGVTELPYDIAGAPVDLATMLLRSTGYNVDKPVMSSDWIKEKMTKLGVRPEPPADPTAKGFYTAGELLSNLTNPAGVTRAGVKGAQKAGQVATEAAKDFQEYNRQLSVPGASYAVRPTGSTMLTGNLGNTKQRFNAPTSGMDQLLEEGLSNARFAAGQNADQTQMLRDFWNTKARNYFSRQFGTPDDPIARAISKKQIRGSALEESFPEYLIDQVNVGKTRVNDQGQERFFPKYPRAMEDFQQRYDEATGLKGSVIAPQKGLGNPQYTYTLSQAGKDLEQLAKTKEEDKLLTQGVRPELINSNVGVTTFSGKEPGEVIGGSTRAIDQLFDTYDLQRKSGNPALLNNITTAIEKGEPIYEIVNMRSPLSNIFEPTAINEYLASIPLREASKMRFEDAVRGALKLQENKAQMENLAARIKSGKPVADSVFSQGVSAPLVQIKNGPLEGFAWKRIEDRKATVPEGAYVGHSVGGYETGGIGYTTEKREGFNTGLWQIYTLRDNRNRPVNTIEVKMRDENTPVVTQIKGNGRATGNVPADKYDTAILDFLQDYLKPAAIEEKDELLTPVLQAYKRALDTTSGQ